MLTRGAPPEIEREAQLVTACAAGRSGRVAELAREGIDWDTVDRLAVRHGIEPLVAQGVLAQPTDLVPGAVAQKLRDHLRGVAQRTLTLARELLRVLGALETANIDAIPYKGHTLAQILYRNMGLRDPADLDILIRKKEVLKARDVLLELGYRPLYELTNAGVAATLSANSEFPMVRADGTLTELQWALTPAYFSFPMDFEALLARRQRVPVGGSSVATLGPGDLLTALCIHGTKHRWTCLSWIADVARLVEASRDIDWDVIGRDSRTTAAVTIGLTLAAELIPFEVPQEFQLVRHPELAAAVRRGKQSLWQDERKGMWPQLRFYLQSRKTIWEKTETLFRFTMMPTANDCKTDLPESLFFLYYFLRPFRLLRSHVLSRGDG